MLRPCRGTFHVFTPFTVAFLSLLRLNHAKLHTLNQSCLHARTRSEAFRAALILLDEDAISRDGFNGPYAESRRQKGFVTFGVSHVMKILGSVEMAQRAAWYQKWNVHLFARPEVRLPRFMGPFRTSHC